MKYIDAHCHVNFSPYDADRNDVIRRAHDAGVGMILVGTDRESSVSAVKLAEEHENIWAIVGLHPTEAVADDSSGQVSGQAFDFDFYKKLALHPKVVGIGECGLDYFHTDPSADENARAHNRLVQAEIFRIQIRLAHELKKPLMLHVRNGTDKSDKMYDAYADVIVILKESKAVGMNIAGNVHFFAGDHETARQFIDLGLYLSFTGVITFADADSYRTIIRSLPLDRILSETDAPFVSPVPYRGRRNEPAYVIEVARAIAAIRNNESQAVIFETLVGNAKKLFGIT